MKKKGSLGISPERLEITKEGSSIFRSSVRAGREKSQDKMASD